MAFLSKLENMPYSNQIKRTYAGIGALIIVLIFFNFLGWLNPVKKLFRRVFNAPLNSFYSWGGNLKENYAFLFDRDKFIGAYDQYLEEKRQNEIISAQIKILTEENKELKNLLYFKEEKKTQLFSTRIIGEESNGTEKIMIINGGTRDGLETGQPVVASQGILVGKISKTEEDISFVRLLSDNQNKVAASILNKDKSMGVVEGGYGISIKMNFVPRNEILMAGDQVVTSGLEEQIPKGLLIGTVVAVENEAYQPFQQAVLTPAVDLTKLNLVGVIITE